MARKKKHKSTQLEAITAPIEALSHDGRGITHIHGKTVFIAGALLGETVQFQYLRQRGSFDEAQAIHIIHAAPARQTPRCPHFGVCGGCALQHIDTELQIQFKQQAFRELLRRQGGIEPGEWLTPIVGKVYGYRRKARLGVKFVAKKNRVFIGFRERRGRLITDSRLCEVLTPEIGQHLAAFATLIQGLSIRDKIPQLEIASADNAHAVVIRHLAAFSIDDLAAVEAFARQYHCRIYLQPGGTDSVQWFYPQSGEELHYRLLDHGLTLEFQPLQFIQINAEVNQRMINRALALLECEPGDRILDLFCGIGNFSLPMAKTGAIVTGVEGDPSAVHQATHNAQINGVTGCEFHSADLFQPTFRQDWAKRTFDKMLIDPPRSGAESVIEAINQWRPRRLVYVSCDLATLARDSQRLISQGYRLARAGIMDMFPHTQHAEAITLFEAI